MNKFNLVYHWDKIGLTYKIDYIIEHNIIQVLIKKKYILRWC